MFAFHLILMKISSERASLSKNRLRLGNGWRSVLQALVPHQCYHCKIRSPVGGFLCPYCSDEMVQCEIPTCELPGWTAAGRPVWAKWYYRTDSPIRSLHRSLKYDGRAAIGRQLGNHQIHFDGVDGWCIPIPSHRTKTLERGFLHTAPIAAAFALANHLQLHLEAFIRPHLSPSQSGLTREFRISNVQGAFYVSKSVEGKHLLLVDDVMTTGATLDSASEVLEKAGATVSLAVLAFRRESFKRP